MRKGSATEKRVAALLVLLALVFGSLGAGLYVLASVPDSSDDPSTSVLPAASPDTVIFGAVGDFDNKAPDYPDMVAEARRLGNRGGMFLLALGDLGYVADEQQWCTKIKSAFNNTLVVAGNHDTTQSGPGDIDNDVIYCPFNIDAPLTPGPTYGYGKSYFFDYPRTSPLVRVLMLTAGTAGTQVQGQDYGSGGAEYNWVVDAVNGARGAGIPWVVVGLHKLCINAGSYGCEIGHALFDKLVDLKVDLILHGHYHTYQRSKQLALSSNCPTIPSDGNFDADCIVASGNAFTKGAGTIDLIDGAGGRDLYTIPLDGSDRELAYFDVAMGSNGNTENKSSGHGPIVVTLNATTLTAETSLCPLGTGDATTGECPSQAPSTVSDRFTISSTGPPPPPSLSADFSFSPSNPVVDQTVTFSGSASGGTPPYAYGWTYGDGATGAGASVSHSYGQTGNYTVGLTVTDAGSQTAARTRTVPVTASPPPPPPPGDSPVTTLSLAGQTGADSWYTSAVTVTLNATSPASPSVTIHYRLDGGSWQTYGAPFSVGDGVHGLNYNATDGLGNVEATKTASFKVDAMPPRTTATLSGTFGRDHWYVTPVTVRLTAADDTSGLGATSYRLDGGTWQTYSAPVVVGEGRHVLDYRSTDLAGLTEALASVSIKVDRTPPHLTTPASGGIQTVATFTFAWSATDDVSGVVGNAVSVDGLPFTSLGTNTTITLTLVDGPHTIGVRATDDASNVAWANVTLRVDTNLFSPSGPLQGMPTYLLLVIVGGILVFLVMRRRARAKRMRRQQAVARMRARGR